MLTTATSARRWASEEFGTAQLGDRRRLERLVTVAAGVAESPAGRVSEVFSTAPLREGAYDFLENAAVHGEALQTAAGRACLERCKEHRYVFVPIDGTSLTLIDRRGGKDFGSVGSSNQGIPGLNAMTAIAVDPAGVPLGVADMQWWARTRRRKDRKTDRRPVREKETQRWIDAVNNVCDRAREVGLDRPLWFQLDREADSWPVLHRLATSGHLFTVRSNANRRVVPVEEHRHLHTVVDSAPVRATYEIDVAASRKRSAHRAHVEVRTAVVTLDMRDSRTANHHLVKVSALSVREVGTVLPGEEPLRWLLLTNAVLTSLDAVWQTIFGYCLRWRIEDFHRTWKRGGCNVERTQLRTSSHVIKWATILASVAMRIERLKLLARESPDQPASVELTSHEITALILLKTNEKKRNEVIPESEPTIACALRWIAELGGYTGKSSGGPPGSITIGRGLERVQAAACVIELMHAATARKRPKRARK